MLLKTLDIGHSNMPLDMAMTVLETEVSNAIFEGRIRVMKVIHGHGSGALRNAIRQWCGEQEGRFRRIIPGEDYDYLNPDAMDMRRDCGQPADRDLGKKNRAVTYIWFW